VGSSGTTEGARGSVAATGAVVDAEQSSEFEEKQEDKVMLSCLSTTCVALLL